jgi:hypothetical protein
MGLDLDGDDRIDNSDLAAKLELNLKRYETIPITLPPGQLFVVEARCVQKDVPLYARCDLAITHEDATRDGERLTVVVHNLGCLSSGPFTVRIRDASGTLLAQKTYDGLEGIADLKEKKVALTFDELPSSGPLDVTVHGPDKEITEFNNRARVSPH